MTCSEDCDHETRTFEVDVAADSQCCERMLHFLRADDLPIFHTSKLREWGINYPGDSSFQEIQFCPWCGAKLPGSLRDEWFDRIRAAGLDPDDEDVIPSAMRDDRWWKEEGL